MRYVLIILAFVIFGVFVCAEDAFALPCDSPAHCYGLQQHRQNFVDGLEYDLSAPDLFVKRSECLNDIAVSTGWLRSASNREWAEAGVTKGHLTDLDDTDVCVTQLSTYYAYNTMVGPDDYNYLEIIVPNGRVDPGDNVDVKIQKNDQNQIRIHVNTPDRSDEFASARITLQPDNNYYFNGDNDLYLVLYQDKTSTCERTYTLSFLDEDHPYLDAFYDGIREWHFNRVHDVESFIIKNNNQIEFDDSWSSSNDYDCLTWTQQGCHATTTKTYYPGQTVYVSNTWNHMMDTSNTNPNSYDLVSVP